MFPGPANRSPVPFCSPWNSGQVCDPAKILRDTSSRAMTKCKVVKKRYEGRTFAAGGHVGGRKSLTTGSRRAATTAPSLSAVQLILLPGMRDPALVL